jgi:O-acetyl-ADP-ribose deacetylase (regulator of RNase III)
VITEVSGNLLEAETEALVNTVNIVGAAGKGIALQFRLAFPENFKEYQLAARQERLAPGTMFVHATGQLHPRFIINFPTKRHWRSPSRLDDIRAGLSDLVRVLERNRIRSVAVPPLGCGNGGLSWSEVRPLIVEALGSLDIDVKLYPPNGAPEFDSMPVRTSRPRMTLGRAVLLLLIQEYRTEDRFRLSALEVQKLAYFLQAYGENLRLTYVKARYGPYAEALNHVLQTLEGHFIRGYGDRSREPQIRALPGAAAEATEFLREHPEALKRLELVRELVDGWDTPYGLELLATTHWALRNSRPPIKGRDEMYDFIASWTPRKAQLFKPAQIDRATAHLAAVGAISPPAWL